MSLQSREEQQAALQFQWLVREHLEGFKNSVEALIEGHMLRGERRSDQALEHMEGLLREHTFQLEAKMEASTLKLQRQEQRLEESIERFLQQHASSEVLAGRPRPHAGGPAGGAEGEAPVAVLSEERLQAMHEKHMEDIVRVLEARGQGRPTGKNVEALLSSDKETVEPTPSALRSNFAVRLTSTREDVNALAAVQGLTTSEPQGPVGASAAGPKVRRPFYVNPLSGLMTSFRGRETEQADWNFRVDVVGAAVILINFVWMGFEAEIALHAAAQGQPPPDWTRYVEVGFGLAFTCELGCRWFLQGNMFWKCPHLKYNFLDGVIILFQMGDALFSVFNMSSLRSIRVLRLCNAARLIRSLDQVKTLRLLMSSISGCLVPLFWVLLLLSLVIYLCSIAVIQTIQAHYARVSTLDPALLEYYGSVGSCMLTLFMSVSGGKEWQSLMKPLADISPFFIVGYVVFITVVMCGLLNIITAIFVENTKALARQDVTLQMRDMMTSKESVVGKIRHVLTNADADGSGTLSYETLQRHLQDPDFVLKVKSVGLETWEVTGLFQLLDGDFMGQVSIDELIHGLVRMKNKSEQVDLATVMYENKRILTRLLAFMRFSEDHFKHITAALGHVSTARSIQHYLEEVIDVFGDQSAGSARGSRAS